MIGFIGWPSLFLEITYPYRYLRICVRRQSQMHGYPIHE